MNVSEPAHGTCLVRVHSLLHHVSSLQGAHQYFRYFWAETKKCSRPHCSPAKPISSSELGYRTRWDSCSCIPHFVPMLETAVSLHKSLGLYCGEADAVRPLLYKGVTGRKESWDQILILALPPCMNLSNLCIFPGLCVSVYIMGEVLDWLDFQSPFLLW